MSCHISMYLFGVGMKWHKSFGYSYPGFKSEMDENRSNCIKVIETSGGRDKYERSSSIKL